MKRRFRLRRTSDILRARRQGKSYANTYLVMFVLPVVQQTHSRVGFSISRRVGNAVRRNYIRRRLKACFNSILPQLQPGWDVLVVARRPISKQDVSYADLQAAVNELLVLAGLLNNDGS